MFIKSIVLDGFKSYGQRTVVGPFDPEFNAITGLNGTGKSNILDSICFVLGITNLSHVRAASLQDLIFKSGQAGIKKASVSLVFDNSNPERSPPGFEQVCEITVTRQVEIGGKTKYLLNGHVAQHKKVQDIFCSVQLNVNNPNFLVMQGKITKVLNMKPVEILSMIEEAAGTTMYQKKREQCVKQIERKNTKMQELRNVVTEELRPKLDKLREERTLYDEYCHMERESEHLMRIYQAWQFCAAQRNTIVSKNAMEKSQAKMQDIENKIEQNLEQIHITDKEIEEAHKKANAEEADKLAELEGRLKVLQESEVQANADEKAAKDALNEEETHKKQLLTELKDRNKDLELKENELNKLKNMYENLKVAKEADSEAYAASQRKFEAISVGMEINEEGVAETLQEQLIHARSAVAQAKMEHQQATMQMEYCQKELQKKEDAFASSTTDTRDYKVQVAQVQKEIQDLENRMASLNFGGENEIIQLQERAQQLTQESRNLKDTIYNFTARRPYTNFTYTDPTPNFDRRQVHGPICKLIKVKSPETAFALEIAAGGRLYEIVVDNENVSKLLINNGNLQRRRTFIPLNKVKGRYIPQDIVNFAQRLVGSENVSSALSMVAYNKKFERAIEYVFGDVLICKDLNTARRVAFHERIRRKCVTLEGDVVDPAGVFEGGAIPKETPMLQHLEEVMRCEEQLKTIEMEFNNVEQKIAQMGDVQKKWVALRDQLDLKQLKLGMLQKALQQTSHYQLEMEIDNLKKEISLLSEKLKQTEIMERKNNEKAIDLEKKVKDSKGYKEKQFKQVEMEMQQLKKKMEKSRDNWQKHEQNYETLNLEINELKKEIINIKEQLDLVEQNLLQLQEKYEIAKIEAGKKKEQLAELHLEIKAEKRAAAEKNHEIQKQVKKKEQLQAQIADMKLQIQKLQHEVNRLEDSYKMHVAKEKEYSKKCKDENVIKEAQGLSEHEGNELEKRIRHAQERKNVLSKTVNPKAQSLYEYYEKQFHDIQTKTKSLLRDKAKIEQAIALMDQKKTDTIIKAHQQVTKDFGSIFGTLLPGANAELRPLLGKTVLDGLEVKVSLGGVWKENMGELSGGQRSLAALSLILAMLLFKPAPLYILDEVDAALDESHTQNIGNMIKSHFKQSQFIIVSLHDGMFNNANVLFRTQFVDGVSAVKRTAS